MSTELEFWNSRLFVQNWRGMENALRLLRNDVSKRAYAYAFVPGYVPVMSDLGFMNLYAVALCHFFEVAMKSLVSLYTPVKRSHNIEKMFNNIPSYIRDVLLQMMWDRIPPKLEVSTPKFSDAILDIDGALKDQRYGPWESKTAEEATQKLDAPPEWMWMFVVTSYAVTTVIALRMIRGADDRIREANPNVHIFSEDDSVNVWPRVAGAKLGCMFTRFVIDTPMGSTVPLFLDLSEGLNFRVCVKADSAGMPTELRMI